MSIEVFHDSLSTKGRPAAGRASAGGAWREVGLGGRPILRLPALSDVEGSDEEGSDEEGSDDLALGDDLATNDGNGDKGGEASGDRCLAQPMATA